MTFDPDPLRPPDDEPVPYHDTWANGRQSRYRLRHEPRRLGCSVFVLALVLAWWLA